MVTSNISLPILDWTNGNKQEAFCEWVDFMTSDFVINSIKEKLKYSYILLSIGPKDRDVIRCFALN